MDFDPYGGDLGGIERRAEFLGARRRMREKTTVKGTQVDEQEQSEEQRWSEQRKRWEKVIQEEMMRLIVED